MSVYLDQIWMVNALLDYLLLVCTARMSSRQIERLRYCLVAALGGGYAAAGFLWPFLHTFLLRILWGCFLGWLAFRSQSKWGRSMALFFLLSTALAGVLTALGITKTNISCHVLLVASGVFYLLLEIVSSQGARFARNEIKPVCVAVGGRSCALRALRDTGNMLRSPATGAPVLIAELSAMSHLWSREEASVLLAPMPPQDKVAKMYERGNTRFSLLPYTAVGGSGLLLCMRSDAVTIGKRRYAHAPVALTEQTLSAHYEALWGGEEDTYAVAPIHTCVDTAQAG